MIIFTIVNCIVFCLIAALHIYWAFGGKWGMANVIPKLEGKPLFQPGRISTLIVASGLLGFAAIHVRALGCFTIGSASIIGYILLIIVAIFSIRSIGDFNYIGLFKKKKSSSFAIWDTKLYVPLCILIAFNSFITYWFVLCN
ncbi:MAG: DUF3995 domain-containing protein [Saprospiraceae bacterium]|nr:DUF3995 domain-containing protein [Saprospiraceae bacterium]